LIERGRSHGQIKGLIPHLVDGGLSILQYAYDTMLFTEHVEKVRKQVNYINIRAIIGSIVKFPEQRVILFR
jgi:hypothetical protein